MLGLHWGFTPVTLQNLEMFGGDVLEGAAVCAVFAQIGIAVGVYLKGKKHSKIRGIAGPTIITRQPQGLRTAPDSSHPHAAPAQRPPYHPL